MELNASSECAESEEEEEEEECICTLQWKILPSAEGRCDAEESVIYTAIL